MSTPDAPSLPPMSSAEIRRRFLDHFVARGHTLVPSASLISPDPSTLLTIAGMVPFMPYFLGQEKAPYARATSVQKCVRTLDIEEVGKTTRHGSFFQMAGNFSFGDYFKQGAIPLAWELLTGSRADGGYGFDESKLWVTVYLDDDEAEEIWRRDVGVPADRIQRLGMADNYWSTGGPGPCGPCSEIFYDRGPAFGPEGGPAVGGERYLEVWNLVFMQYERGEGTGKGAFPILGDLPKKNIDTGMGMERMATLLQGVDNLYEIDTSRAILDRAAALAQVRYGADPESDVRLRVVADHARTAAMLIGDGITPSNEGRGYVLRRIVRRAVRAMRLLGAHDPVMGSLIEASISAMGPQYPELVTEAGRISTVAIREEGSFLETLRTGAQVFETAVPAARAAGGVLSGERAFALHDTYGFPIDLTLEMAAEQGLSVDEEGFRALMQGQRSRAKADSQARRTRGDTSAYRALRESAGSSVFTGYAEVTSDAVVRGLLHDGEVAQAAPAGATVQVVLDRTPFYAEAGGQLADSGRLVLADGTELEVSDVQRALPDLVVHTARVVRGEARTGAQALAEVDVERRRSVSRAHTATHLVHQALRDALGEQATQAGSLNAPGRFRFDFASPSAVPGSVLADVEQQINEIALADLEVRAFVTTQDEARRIGAMALFGEKYGDEVRVVEVGDYARELCGGTHAARSGQLGMVKLLGEASIGAGTRRVEGLVGLDAYRHLAREHVLLAQLAEAFKVPAEEVPDRVASTVARLREAEKELGRLQAAQVLQRAGEFAAQASDVYGFAFVGVQAPAGTPGDLVRSLALDIRGRVDHTRPAAVLVAAGGDRVTLVAAVNDAGRARGLSANALLREAAPAVGGKGGGKDDVAQGGGNDASGIAEALRLAEYLVGRVATS